MDSRSEFYKAAFVQWGAGFEILVFEKISKYQYGQGFGDVLRVIVRFIPRVTKFLKPVAMTGVQTL